MILSILYSICLVTLNILHVIYSHRNFKFYYVDQISEWAKEVSTGVSVFTLTALSAERYCAIVNPLRRHAATGNLGDKAFTLLTALFIWILAIAIATPAAVFSHVQVTVLDERENRSIMVSYKVIEKKTRIWIWKLEYRKRI